MADDTTTVSATDDKPTEPAAEQDAEATTESTEATTDDVAGARNPDVVKKTLDAERKARRDAEKRAREYEQRVREFEDRDKSEQQKLEERAGKAETELADLKGRLLRHEVAAVKKLPGELADRLQGSTREEMEADADQLLKLVSASNGRVDFDGGARTEAPVEKEPAQAHNDFLLGVLQRERANE